MLKSCETAQAVCRPYSGSSHLDRRRGEICRDRWPLQRRRTPRPGGRGDAPGAARPRRATSATACGAAQRRGAIAARRVAPQLDRQRPATGAEPGSAAGQTASRRRPNRDAAPGFMPSPRPRRRGDGDARPSASCSARPPARSPRAPASPRSCSKSHPAAAAEEPLTNRRREPAPEPEARWPPRCPPASRRAGAGAEEPAPQPNRRTDPASRVSKNRACRRSQARVPDRARRKRLRGIVRRDPRPRPTWRRRCPNKGELLPNYYAVTKGELANQIALISGQGPTAETAANCPNYTDVTPGTVSRRRARSKATVASTRPSPDPARPARGGMKWKAYVEDIGNGARRQPTTCRHPALGAPTRPGAAPRRRLRDLAQPVRLLPLAHRRARMRRSRRRPRTARRRPEDGDDDAGALLHRPQRLPRRRRSALRTGPARRPRRRRRIPRRRWCRRSRPRRPTRKAA